MTDTTALFNLGVNRKDTLKYGKFYRAMLWRARYCCGKLSVCPSVSPWRWGTLIT